MRRREMVELIYQHSNVQEEEEEKKKKA